MAGVVPKKLSELQQSTKNAIVTALIVTKTEPKYFLVKNNMEYRGVITFTLRDSKSTICNCKYWGCKESVEEHNRKMKIGDVINVVCPLVLNCKFSSDENTRFLPRSTLTILLVVNEGTSSLQLNDYQDVQMLNRLQPLMSISHKPLRDALRLSDIRFSYMAVGGGDVADNDATPVAQKENRKRMPKQKVDLLVMVAQLRPVKEIQRANVYHCLEVVVFDESEPEGMLFCIWQNNWIERAQQYWQPMKTVLHLIDVDLVDSSFYRCCILRKNLQTVIYENPLGKEADSLQRFAATQALPRDYTLVAQLGGADTLPNPSDIRTQMTVKQIYARREGHLKNNETDEFTAVLYAMITKFDIDGFTTVVSRKCKLCRKILSNRASFCDSDSCRQLANSSQHHNAHSKERFEYFYNFNVHFSDHTGTLAETHLAGTIAERIFEIPAADFQNHFKHNEKMLDDLKWRYLMQHFEVKLLIKKPTAIRRQSLVLAVDMQPIGLDVVVNKMMVF